MNGKKVILVACDGADGRIMAILFERLQEQGQEVTVLVMIGGLQGQGGAEGLFRGENRPAVYVAPEDENVIRDQLAGAACVVCGHPYNRWELSPVLMRIAFDLKVPVIRVPDHGFWNYDDEKHPGYMPGIVQSWEGAGRPPFIMTAVNGVHEQEMHAVYPDLPVKIIGSPLHYQLEECSANRARLRQELLPNAGFVLSVFFAAQREKSFQELASEANLLVLGCGQAYEKLVVLLNVHSNVEQYRTTQIDPMVRSWIERGITVQTYVEQTQMIVVADVVYTSPLSTTATRALHAQVPVLVCWGPKTKADARTAAGSAEEPVPEIACGGLAYWNYLICASEAVQDAIRTSAERYEKTKAAGLICPPGAMNTLVQLAQKYL